MRALHLERYGRFDVTAEAFAARKRTANAVDGNIELRADLLVASPFQVGQPDDLSLAGRQLAQELLHLFEVFETGLGSFRLSGFGNLMTVALGLHFTLAGSAGQRVHAVLRRAMTVR